MGDMVQDLRGCDRTHISIKFYHSKILTSVTDNKKNSHNSVRNKSYVTVVSLSLSQNTLRDCGRLWLKGRACGGSLARPVAGIPALGFGAVVA